MKTKPFDLERALSGDRVVIKFTRGNVIEVVNLIDTKDDGLPLLAIFKSGKNHDVAWFNYSGTEENPDDESSSIHLLMVDEEPLKLVVGKFYKTRDGKKAYVYKKAGSGSSHPFRYVCAEKHNNYPDDYFSCKEYGTYKYYETSPEHDLIEEWND